MASIIKVDQIQTASGGTPTAADLGINTSGSVIQVVQTVVNSNALSKSGTTFSDITGFSASITPSSASNKILVLFAANVGHNTATGGAFRMLRDSTPIGGGVNDVVHWFYLGNANTSYGGTGVSNNFLDSPNTTNSVTYKMQWASDNGSYPIYLNNTNSDPGSGYGNGISSLTLMEIAG